MKNGGVSVEANMARSVMLSAAAETKIRLSSNSSKKLFDKDSRIWLRHNLQAG